MACPTLRRIPLRGENLTPSPSTRLLHTICKCKCTFRNSTPLLALESQRQYSMRWMRRQKLPSILALSRISSRKDFCDGGRHSSVAHSSLSSDGSTESSSPSSSLLEDTLDSYAIKVVSADAMAYNVPLLAPFAIATTTLELVRNVAIRVTLQDGNVGWGESPTLPPVTAEDQPLALAKASEACTFLMTQPALSLRDLLIRLSSFLPGHGLASVRAGMEMALLDAAAVSLEIPLWKLFGGCSSSIITDITIPICAPEEAEQLAVQYARMDFGTIKTKVGGRALSSDISLLQAIRRGHPSCDLILDANCGYRADEALQLLRGIHDFGLIPTLFEQPVGRDDWEGLRYVSQTAKALYGVPVAADESCRSLQDARRITNDGLAEVINVKLAKLGVMESLEVVKLARKEGMTLMIGGMVETRLAMGFAAHLAAGLGCFRFVDLDTPLLLAEDPVRGGYSVSGAVYSVSPESRGHGGTLELPLSHHGS